MRIFREQLAQIPYDDLRAMATRLGVRTRGQERKEEWVDAITTFWQTPDRCTPHLAALSPGAQAALVLLRRAQQLPAPLFFADHGPIRRPGRQKDEAPPWTAPRTVSEELYYSGLLHGVENGNLERTDHVTAPAFVDALLGHARIEDAPATADHRAWPLLHDLATYLIYRQQHADLRLLHGRWLPPVHMAALNRRLLQPEAEPLPRSHKAAPRLRFLAFLARSATLTTAQGLTAQGWQWLADAPAEQLMTLWRAWQRSPQELRQRYAQPDGDLAPPWPRPLVRVLAQQPDDFSAQEMAARLLGEGGPLWRYYVAHLSDSQALTHMVAELLAAPLTQLGLVQPTEDPPNERAAPSQRLYRCTPTGAWLLRPVLLAPVIRPDAGSPGAVAAWLDAEGPVDTPRPALDVQVDATLPAEPVAHLALFADHAGLARDADPSRHRYRLHRETLARAAADGHPFHRLQDALNALDISLDAAHWATLHRWHQAGQTMRLMQLPLLRATRSDEMVALWQDRRLRPLFGELLSPTTATLTTDLAEAARLLRRSGHWVPLPGSEDQGPPAEDAGDAEETVHLAPADAAALWLACQLYLQLGDHLVLPVLLPHPLLETLWQQIEPAQRALVQSQRDVLQERLTALLDGYALTPPLPAADAPDPAQWRPHIDAAIANGQRLTLRYYTASRNLLTERLVDPYWIEERHGVRYLRAYCHHAEQVLVFRVDRIRALWVGESGRPTRDDRQGTTDGGQRVGE